MKTRGLTVLIVSALAMVTCASVALTAVSAQSATPASRSVDVVAAPPAAAITVPATAYERKGRRDPFVPIEIGPEEEPPTMAARLTGIVRGKHTHALLETPDGRGYVMKVGDMLGSGRLIEIRKDSVVFSVPGRRGPRTFHVVLRLPSD